MTEVPPELTALRERMHETLRQYEEAGAAYRSARDAWLKGQIGKRPITSIAKSLGVSVGSINRAKERLAQW